jgi:environmental stress-induced protein Ves
MSPGFGAAAEKDGQTREGLAVSLLDPALYRRVPWKNGGGVSVDVAWGPAESWRFGRTPIVAPGPFSDYSGSERWQVLVAGRGLVLQTPDGEIDVRQPFRPVSFAGETKITSRLEAGPVEVVNLIGDRSRVQLGLSVLRAGDSQAVNRRRTIVYCAAGPAKVTLGNQTYDLPAEGGLDIPGHDTDPGEIACAAGLVVVASIG